MTKTRPQRERTSWDWKPFIIIPMMVYLYVAPQETVFSHGVSSATASLATPAVATPFNAAPQDHTKAFVAGPKGNTSNPAVAAPVQGVTGDGKAFVCPPNPKWPVLEFCWMLTDERR